MRTRLVAVACALVALASVTTVAQAADLRAGLLPQAPTGARHLVFNEEFTASPVRWATCYPWWPASSAGCTNEGNPDEQQWYVPFGATTASGRLRLTADRRTTTGTFKGQPKTYQYVSGMVQSRSRFSFQYGYVEMRMKLAPGAGMWDAAWLLPNRWDHKGEIDIFEAYGQAPTGLALTYHSPDGRRYRKEIPSGLADLTAGYHTYGIDWEPTRLTWYLDDRPLFVSNVLTPTEPMYVLANLAVAGRYLTPTSPASSSASIDYIRVWQR